MKKELKRLLELGAGIYIENEIVDIIDIAEISDSITIKDKEYRLLTWIGIGEDARWHSITIDKCKFDGDTIRFKYLGKDWSIGLLQGVSSEYAEFYTKWRTDFDDITELRISKIDRIMEAEHDILLSRISSK